MVLRKFLREDVLLKMERQLNSTGKSLHEMSVMERIELFKDRDIWISPEKAHKYEITICCPICLEKLGIASCPLDRLGRKYARHKKGGGTPKCRDMNKERIRDFNLGLDTLFGPDPKKEEG